MRKNANRDGNYRMSDSAPMYALLIIMAAGIGGGGIIAGVVITIIRMVP